MKRTYQSEQLMVCHEEAKALHDIGAITDARMREFDEMCLAPAPTPKVPGGQRRPAPAYTAPQKAAGR
jgi:DNA-binding transcriptional regulator YiaG